MTARQDVDRCDGSTGGLRHFVVSERGAEDLLDKCRKPVVEGVGLSRATYDTAMAIGSVERDGGS